MSSPLSHIRTPSLPPRNSRIGGRDIFQLRSLVRNFCSLEFRVASSLRLWNKLKLQRPKVVSLTYNNLYYFYALWFLLMGLVYFQDSNQKTFRRPHNSLYLCQSKKKRKYISFSCFNIQFLSSSLYRFRS
jgi:hypothetical protein